MKTQGVFVITILAAARLLAADQSSNPSATAKTMENKKTGLLERIFRSETKDEGKIERVEGLSSLPWATTVGWNAAASRFSDDPANREAQLYLFSIGSEPQPDQK